MITLQTDPETGVDHNVLHFECMWRPNEEPEGELRPFVHPRIPVFNDVLGYSEKPKNNRMGFHPSMIFDKHKLPTETLAEGISVTVDLLTQSEKAYSVLMGELDARLERCAHLRNELESNDKAISKTSHPFAERHPALVAQYKEEIAKASHENTEIDQILRALTCYRMSIPVTLRTAYSNRSHFQKRSTEEYLQTEMCRVTVKSGSKDDLLRKWRNRYISTIERKDDRSLLRLAEAQCAMYTNASAAVKQKVLDESAHLQEQLNQSIRTEIKSRRAFEEEFRAKYGKAEVPRSASGWDELFSKSEQWRKDRETTTSIDHTIEKGKGDVASVVSTEEDTQTAPSSNSQGTSFGVQFPRWSMTEQLPPFGHCTKDSPTVYSSTFGY
ncbi:uncharacterized protein IL334_007708 [Kwoniella shivajii]|uniref:Uncharacterized protein n=1 Tax=Kwoniella shivajii TaxID=564305 RepID=A0ABZ1D9Z8_9TREE|nr:hypothetical protein IL334_007708 [Kwoniella shivajii]